MPLYNSSKKRILAVGVLMGRRGGRTAAALAYRSELATDYLRKQNRAMPGRDLAEAVLVRLGLGL